MTAPMSTRIDGPAQRSLAGTARSLAALAALIALVAGTPLLLVALGGYPQSIPTGADLVRVATQRDTGPVLQGVLTVLVWSAWAVFVTATIREAVAAVRSRGAATARPLPGFAVVSVPAAALVHTALALVFVAPVLLTAAPPAAAHTRPTTPPPPPTHTTARRTPGAALQPSPRDDHAARAPRPAQTADPAEPGSDGAGPTPRHPVEAGRDPPG